MLTAKAEPPGQGLGVLFLKWVFCWDCDRASKLDPAGTAKRETSNCSQGLSQRWRRVRFSFLSPWLVVTRQDTRILHQHQHSVHFKLWIALILTRGAEIVHSRQILKDMAVAIAAHRSDIPTFSQRVQLLHTQPVGTSRVRIKSCTKEMITVVQTLRTVS